MVGAGIAGAACCLRLTQIGFRPLWIAPAEPVRDKPGELLSAAARPLLAALDAEGLLSASAHRPAHSMFSAWGSDSLAERSSIVHLEGPQTVLHRAVFERALTGLAAQGTELVREPLLRCAPEGQGWRLECENRKVSCDLAIDASGRKAVLVRDRATRFRADRLAALYGFLEQDPGSDVEPTPATLVEAVPDGWFYATCLADGRLALNFYTDADLMRDASGGKEPAWEAVLRSSISVRRWIEEAGFRLPEKPMLASAATTWFAPCAGATWLAVGDAAAAFDPLSSHGMTSALWTGIQGAQAAAARLGGDPHAPDIYARRVANGVQEFLTGRRRIYAQETRFLDSAFWQRRQQPEETVPV
ncbi:2-polyprenyl-6-methoxyphenol hydroxylase-like FAD-dependent oxidoreductase [Roseibium marinum]|uniref:2-polyprenyl-6-methoxyphenol hydroxylase-like FAD-dependent oxidoreductase n=1 Tax=Roseibium marinum TaxID=281252 RepID=A0A2S3UXA1_9HYPH|nr:2-polyprenyl-6-methoxyphenol hydroxylase-like FAD-dependent oxidoreductase [Roseibium marinum]